MAYSEALAGRIRAALDERSDVVERKMFGGLAFMVAGNMACGVIGDELMARVGPAQYDDALSRPHARPMDFTGKPLRGMVYVGQAGVRTGAMLAKWIERTVSFALSAPKPKARKKSRKAGAFPANKRR